MSEHDRLFVVVDPAQEQHMALKRAIITSQIRQQRPRLYLFFAVNSEAVDTHASNSKLFRNKSWLDAVLKPVETAGIEYELEFCWSREWHKSILKSSCHYNPRTILLVAAPRQLRNPMSFGSAYWELLRNAQSPVLLVRPGAGEKRSRILAAVNYQNNSKDYAGLNNRIIERGEWLASHYGATLHIVNAYSDSMDYPDYGRLANRTRLPADRIHVRPGSTESVLTETAKEVGADIVLLGTRPERGMSSMIRRNTAARVARKLDVDLMVVN